MQPLPETATDADLIAFVDRWAGLLEREDYAAAFDMIEHEPGWSPSLIRQIIKSYGEAREDQRVTVAGVPSDVCQPSHSWMVIPSRSPGSGRSSRPP